MSGLMMLSNTFQPVDVVRKLRVGPRELKLEIVSSAVVVVPIELLDPTVNAYGLMPGE